MHLGKKTIPKEINNLNGIDDGVHTKKIEIQNVECIQSNHLEFEHSDANVNLTPLITESELLPTSKQVIKKPLDLKSINTFFLTKDQKKAKKVAEEQEKLKLEIQDSKKISMEFSKGKSVNPFLQPRKYLQPHNLAHINNNNQSISYLNGDTCESGVRFRPFQILHAPWPSCHNSHVNSPPISNNPIAVINTPFKLKEVSRRYYASFSSSSLPILKSVAPIKYILSNELSVTSHDMGRAFDSDPDVICYFDEIMAYNVANGKSSVNMDIMDKKKILYENGMVKISRDNLISYLESIHGSYICSSSASKALVDKILRSKNDEIINKKELWCEFFKPTQSDQILGSYNAINSQRIKAWLKQWKPQLDENKDSNFHFTKKHSSLPMSNSKKEKKSKNPKISKKRKIINSDDDFITDDDSIISFTDDEDDDDLTSYFTPKNTQNNNISLFESELNYDPGRWKNEIPIGKYHLLLLGPSGSGKTAAVRAAASECGYDIVEIHSGQPRGGKDVLGLLAEATKSHAVSGETASSLVKDGGVAGWISVLSAMNAAASIENKQKSNFQSQNVNRNSKFKKNVHVNGENDGSDEFSKKKTKKSIEGVESSVKPKKSKKKSAKNKRHKTIGSDSEDDKYDDLMDIYDYASYNEFNRPNSSDQRAARALRRNQKELNSSVNNNDSIECNLGKIHENAEPCREISESCTPLVFCGECEDTNEVSLSEVEKNTDLDQITKSVEDKSIENPTLQNNLPISSDTKINQKNGNR